MFRCFCSMVVLTTCLLTNTGAQVFFQDDFDEPGPPANWFNVFGGSAIVENGHLSLSNDSLLAAGFSQTADVSIRTQLRVGERGDGGLLGRVVGANHEWYFVQLGKSGFLTLGDAQGSPQISEFAMLDPVSNDLIVHFDLFGPDISVTAWEVGRPETAHRISFVDDTHVAGPFGLWTDDEVQVRWFQAVHESADCNTDQELNVLDVNCSATDMLNQNLTALGLIQGDADGNGRVEFADFVRLSAHYGRSGKYTDGDFDKSGEIDFSDFLVLSSKFG